MHGNTHSLQLLLRENQSTKKVIERYSVFVILSLKNMLDTISVIKSSICPTALAEATLFKEKAENQHAVVTAAKKPTNIPSFQWIKVRLSSFLLKV